MNKESVELVMDAIAVVFEVDNTRYYNYRSYDSSLSESTNVDNATREVENAISKLGLIESHSLATQRRCFVNLKECSTAAVIQGYVVKMTGKISLDK